MTNEQKVWQAYKQILKTAVMTLLAICLLLPLLAMFAPYMGEAYYRLRGYHIPTENTGKAQLVWIGFQINAALPIITSIIFWIPITIAKMIDQKKG